MVLVRTSRRVTTMVMDQMTMLFNPRYGASGRPLWTARDRDAEVIRTVLRKAGRREFSERHGRFVVEGAGDGRPFQVACADDAEASAQELARYSGDLRKPGYRVEPDWRVTSTALRSRSWLQPQRSCV
ncbi:hypothetical protein ACTMTI_47680 [Nonomuraea sp. H19]|uniref:hypothetical protein n=1 Tax=Nonomuraea sp. H19 TaxID=3452206 RepID=UPI003F8935E2